MCSPLKGFLLIVSLKATIDKWRFRFWFRGVQFISAVCCTPQRSSPRWVAHRGDHLRGMQHTAKIISAVCCTPLRWSPRYVAHRWDHLRGVLHTAEIVSVVCTEIISAVWCTPRRLSLRCVAHRGDRLCSMLHTAETTLWSNISTKSKQNSKIL